MSEAPADGAIVGLTDRAVARIAELIAKEGNPALMLRLAISGGGCSGFSYSIDLDDKRTEDDQIFEAGGVALVIDTVSLNYVGGSVVDFVEDLMGSSFQVKNPNATSSCGCGSSFSV